MTFGALLLSPAHRGYQLPEDDIGIFLNYEIVARVKSKAEALKIIDELLKDAPGEVIAHRDYLERSL